MMLLMLIGSFTVHRTCSDQWQRPTGVDQWQRPSAGPGLSPIDKTNKWTKNTIHNCECKCPFLAFLSKWSQDRASSVCDTLGDSRRPEWPLYTRPLYIVLVKKGLCLYSQPALTKYHLLLSGIRDFPDQKKLWVIRYYNPIYHSVMGLTVYFIFDCRQQVR